MEMFLEHTLGALGRALSALPSLFFFASIMLMSGFAYGHTTAPCDGWGKELIERRGR